MPTFRIGTKVKLARPANAVTASWEGHILDLRIIAKGTQTPFGPLPFDCNSTVEWNNGMITVQHTDQLEPILYDGSKVATWDTCVWRPSKETEK